MANPKNKLTTLQIQPLYIVSLLDTLESFGIMYFSRKTRSLLAKSKLRTTMQPITVKNQRINLSLFLPSAKLIRLILFAIWSTSHVSCLPRVLKLLNQNLSWVDGSFGSCWSQFYWRNALESKKLELYCKMILLLSFGVTKSVFFLRELDIVVGPNKEPLNNFARYYPLFLKI